MASLDYSRRMTLSTGTHGRPGLVTRTFAALRDWRESRQTRDMLDKLSDRELDDIGLTRGNIDRAVAEGWTR